MTTLLPRDLWKIRKSLGPLGTLRSSPIPLNTLTQHLQPRAARVAERFRQGSLPILTLWRPGGPRSKSAKLGGFRVQVTTEGMGLYTKVVSILFQPYLFKRQVWEHDAAAKKSTVESGCSQNIRIFRTAQNSQLLAVGVASYQLIEQLATS